MKLTALLLSLALIAENGVGQNQDATFVNGVDGYILVPAHASLVPPAAITVEAWVVFNGAGLGPTNLYPTIIRKNVANGQEEYFLRVEGVGSLRWKIKTSAATSVIVDSPSPMPSGVWTHVAGTYDGATAKLYMNGALVGQAAGAGAPYNGGAALRIGKGDDQTSPSEVWSGKLDEVRIWSVARTAAQIQSTMNVEAVAVPNLVSSWRMTSSPNDSIGPNSGTLVGSVSFGASGLPLPTGPAPWQVNQPPVIAADVDGVSSDGYLPGIAVRTFSTCAPATATLNLAMSPAAPWNLAITLQQGVTVSGGGLATPGGQIVNLKTASPSFSLLFPSGFGAPTPSLSIPVSLGAPLTASVQAVVLNGASPDGFSLSSMVEFRAVPGTPVIPGPAGDDGVMTVSLANPALCGAPAIMPFFNATYTQFDVSSNGRVLFGSPVPNASGFASVGAALTSDPFVGAWCDLAPNQGGRISISVPASGLVRIDWSEVRYKNAAGSATFGIVLDGNTGTITLDRLGTIQPATINQFLGISAGILGPATNAGPTAFAPGGPFFPGTSFDMIYAFGAAGSLAPGLTAIVFTPTATTFGYAWSAF
jgi:hypothetical protein